MQTGESGSIEENLEGRVCYDCLMKGSSLILPGLALPVQIQSQQQDSHFSASTTLASQFQSFQRVRQYTIRLQRQEVPGLANELRAEFFGVKHFPFPFHGHFKGLKHQISWSKENFKNAFKSYSIRGPKRTVDVQCFSRPFHEFYRPRGNYPSGVTQLPAERPLRFHSTNVDLNKARDVNAPGELDQSTPPLPPDFVPPGWNGRPVPTGSSISEHRSARRAQESTSSQRAPSPANERPGRRFETSYVARGEPLLARSPNRTASSNFYSKENLRTTEARVESENVTTEQAVLSNIQSPSRRWVQQASYEFHDPRRRKKSRMASEPHKREAQSAESYRPVGKAFDDFEGATGRGNDVAQIEAQSPPSCAGAAKWRETASVFEQNQNPSHNVLGGIESLQQTTNSLNVEPDRAVDRKASGTKSLTAKDALEIRQLEPLSREKEGQSTPISEGGVARYGNRDSCRDTPQRNRTIRIGGNLGQAVAVLQNRLQRGVTTDSGTYVKVLQTCLKQRDLLAAKQVHDCIIQSGMDKNLYVAVTLLNLYIKCGKLADARQVFDQLEKKTVVIWTSMIAGYTKSNHAQPALEIFNQMRQKGVRPDKITYLSILKACASPAAIKWGKEIHECIRQEGFESDVRVGTALLNMYSKCGCIVEARQIFENLTKRDIITWNVMIGALAQHGHGHEAYRLFLQMRQEGFEPDAFSVASILNPSASAGALEWVKEVHCHASKAGLESDMRVGNALVHMYTKSGSIDDALKVFDRLEKRDVVTWNIMIGGLAGHGQGHEAYRLFLLMRQEGFEPNAITYISILNASASVGALEWVKELHGHASKAGLESDMRVGSALVHMYAKSGSIDDARLVFDRMEQRNVSTWTVMIGGLAEHGCGLEAYRLFLQMVRKGCEPDAFTYASILNASASAGALEWVKDVHGHASRAGLESDLRVGNALVHMYAESGSIDNARLVFDRMEQRDVFTWTVMIGGLAKHGHGHEAHRLFLQMRQEGFEPDAFTVTSILNPSASAGTLEWVKEVHGHASKAGLESDMRVGNALVHMYAKSGSIDDARRVFDRMEKRDVVTWTAMIGGLAQNGCGHEALELFRKMTADLLKPDKTTFAAVLSACCHRGLVDDGHRLFSAMTQDYGIEPDIVHYNCMVDLLGRAGHLEEARLFIRDMPIEPDAVTWKALLGACRTYGNVELGELVAEELFKLEPSDPSAYVLLSNIYAGAGKWENVSLVRAMMQTRGVRKEPGRSWIEVDKKIHEFVVGDTSHPEADAIYNELNKLTGKLKAEGYIPDTRLVLHDISEEDKELALCSHSEKLAIAYGLLHIPQSEPICVRKNLRVCPDCHTATKLISKVTGREIIARDANRFHHFKDGICSCGDYW